MNEPKTFKVFVDFDGTITQRDVGEAIFLEFGNPDEANLIIRNWIEGSINATQCWQQLCNTISRLDVEQFDRFIDDMKIDPGLMRFVEYCSNSGIEITVVSDGLDYYINRILKKEKLDHLKVKSNRLVIDEHNKLNPVFPYTDEECSKCANCKRNHVLNFSNEEDYSIYIGDGWSDTTTCPMRLLLKGQWPEGTWASRQSNLKTLHLRLKILFLK